jgi:hypothetical protein
MSQKLPEHNCIDNISYDGESPPDTPMHPAYVTQFTKKKGGAGVVSRD